MVILLATSSIRNIIIQSAKSSGEPNHLAGFASAISYKDVSTSFFVFRLHSSLSTGAECGVEPLIRHIIQPTVPLNLHKLTCAN